MYTVSEVVEMGDARELILSEIKEAFVGDDNEPQTLQPGEYFDE